MYQTKKRTEDEIECHRIYPYTTSGFQTKQNIIQQAIKEKSVVICRRLLRGPQYPKIALNRQVKKIIFFLNFTIEYSCLTFEDKDVYDFLFPPSGTWYCIFYDILLTGPVKDRYQDKHLFIFLRT